jgi:peptidyl-tRNA hydrolase, PTH2 family
MSNEDNPLVLYIVVRKDLGMSIGKVAAQASHSMQYIMLRFQEIKQSKEGYLFKSWMNEGNSRKVVLGASDSEWAKLKEEYDDGVDCFIVRDAGHTEVEAGSETCASIWPMYKNDAPKIIKRLQTLK